MKYDHIKISNTGNCVTYRVIRRQIPYEEFTEKCLNLLKPTKAICKKTLEKYPYDIVEGASEFITTCKNKGKSIYIVSGGYEPVFSGLFIKY